MLFLFEYQKNTPITNFWLISIAGRTLYSLSSFLLKQDGKANASKRPDEVSVRFYEFRKRLAPLFCFGFMETLWFTWKSISHYCGSASAVTNATSTGLTYTLLDNAFGPNKVVTTTSTSVLIANFLLLVHMFRRLNECVRVSIFSHRQVSSLPMTLYEYANMLFIVLSVYADGPSFSGVSSEGCFNFSEVPVTTYIALGVYAIGYYLQYKTIRSFVSLRKNKAGHIVTTGYKLPKNGLFNYLSCPHFLGEVLIYSSIGLVLRDSCTWWLLAINVALREVNNAVNTHGFYKEKFSEDLPKGRKAIIPFVL